MHSEYLQNLRYKLQKRVRRLHTADMSLFHYFLKNFWLYLNSEPLLVGIMDDLSRRCPEMQDKVETADKGEAWIGDNELEVAAYAYFIIRKAVQTDTKRSEYERLVGRSYRGPAETLLEQLDTFRYMIVDPLYEYLDEHLDDERATLGFLIRYKQQCEWFEAQRLRTLYETDTRKGEKNLALHLYEYLHNQGIDFNIETWSIVGEPDLIAAQQSDQPLIADVKVFNGSKTNIAKAFNQIYQYTLTYNQPVGYLVIFNLQPNDVRIATAEHNLSTPYVVYSHKTIFFVIIDIFDHEKSASQRGKLKVIDITEQNLLEFVGNPDPIALPDTDFQE